MRRARATRNRDQLRKLTNGLITLDEVAEYFGIRPATARKYVDMGLVWHADREGNRLLFDIREISAAYRRFRSHRRDMSLKAMGRQMRKWVEADLRTDVRQPKA